MLRWFERRFTFDLPIEAFPAVLERLRGTPARIEEKIRSVPPGILTRRMGDGWSIQEHLGHLLDLDELHVGRLDDYLDGKQVLRAADPNNQKTWAANYNARLVEDLLRDFRRERARFLERLEGWDPKLIGRTAFHPRLHQGLRVIDLAVFVADHDDHHLATMTELTRRLRTTAG